MTESIRKYIQEHQMIAPGDTVCIGLSGGADSVCLLLVLLELYGIRADIRSNTRSDVRYDARSDNITDTTFGTISRSVWLTAVHVNHQLRGDAADADEQFVRELCEKYEVPLYTYRYPVADIAAEKGIGTEEAGRLVRQEAYRDCLSRRGASVIALAHHANDRAETFLFHAARGTSLGGLAGIRPVQPFAPVDRQTDKADGRADKADGQADKADRQTYKVDGRADKADSGAESPGRTASIIRPLLCVTREEIEAWLTSRCQPWRTDETNRDESYTRNAIRHSIIPLLEKQINSQTVRHIAEVSSDLDETDRFLREEAMRRAAQYVRQTPVGIQVLSSIEEQPGIMQGYILIDVLEKAGGSRRDLGREQVRQLRELFHLHPGKQIDLPYGLCAVKEAEGILISRRKDRKTEEKKDTGKAAGPVSVTGPGTYSWGAWQFQVRILDNAVSGGSQETSVRMQDIPRKKYTKWMDCDKINGTLCIRGRMQGDRMIINAQGGSRKLKDYLIDEKIPCAKRDDIPLLASGSQIYWAVGYRISEEIKVTEQTKHILEITALPEPAGQKIEDRPDEKNIREAETRRRQNNMTTGEASKYERTCPCDV